MIPAGYTTINFENITLYRSETNWVVENDRDNNIQFVITSDFDWKNESDNLIFTVEVKAYAQGNMNADEAMEFGAALVAAGAQAKRLQAFINNN